MQHSPVFSAGDRFYPTDQELVPHYLDNKVRDHPLPCSCSIKDFNICRKHPREIWDTFGGNDFSSESDEDLALLFFTPLKKKANIGGSIYARSLRGGAWNAEAAGDPVKIKWDKDTEVTIGPEKRFTDLQMYEFATVSDSTDHVLCSLRMSKDKGQKKNSESGVACNHNDALSKKNEKKRKSGEAISCKNRRSKKAKHVAASDQAVGNFESQAANSEVEKSNVCKESGQEIGLEGQHGEGALSDLMIGLQDFEASPFDAFLNIPDEGGDQCCYGLTADEIFPPAMVDKQTNIIAFEEQHGVQAASDYVPSFEDFQVSIEEFFSILDGEGDACCYGLTMDEIFPPTMVG